MLLRNAWYIAAWTDEIGGEPLARRICNDPVVLFRDGTGKAAALADRCCHRAAPLHMGSVIEAGIQCGYHGLVFDGSGQCVAIPGQKQIPEDARVRFYPAVEKDQLVWIWMGDPALADPAHIVDFPYHNDPGRWPNKHDVYPIKGNYMLMVDNLMDLTHLGYLHAKTVGGNPAAHVDAEMKTTRTRTGLKFTRWMKNSVPPPSYVKAAGFKGASTAFSNSSSSRRRVSSNGPARPRLAPPHPTRSAISGFSFASFTASPRRPKPPASISGRPPTVTGRTSPRRPSSSTARSRRPFSKIRRWSRRSRRGLTSSAKRGSSTSLPMSTGCICAAWSSA